MQDTPRPRGRPRLDPDKADTNTVQALDRALSLLKVIAAHPGKTLSDLALLTDQAVATVFRALVTMQAHDIVEAVGPAQLWHVGSGAFRVGNAFLHRSDLVASARLPMEGLMRQTAETVSLGIMVEDRLLCLAQVETRNAIRAYFPPGTDAPLHAAAAGKALLAWTEPDRVQDILGRTGLPRATSLSLSSPESLMRDLGRTRERGFAIDDQEQIEGMRAVAAPIFDAFAEPVAALAVSGPAFRLGLSDATRFGALVRAAADRVTEATGGICP